MATSPSKSVHSGPAPRRVRVIGGIALAFGLIVIGYPFFPKILYAVKKPKPVVPYTTKLQQNDPAFASLPSLPEISNRPVPKENRLVIPRIGVNMPIYDGPD